MPDSDYGGFGRRPQIIIVRFKSEIIYHTYTILYRYVNMHTGLLKYYKRRR